MNEMHDGPLFTEEQLNLASDNYDAQEVLVEDLRRAFVMSRMTHEELASELELSVPDAEAWVSGEVDLHLSQLRHLANAVDAKVTYKVSALRTRYKRELHALEAFDAWQTTEWNEIREPSHLLARHR
ncbi:hypothetical protein [Curtobacterium sp. MCBD17_026]|uniref:hypothetical protein n=1 Tax=Curtobacterium sp. MCBD17_026 TaxID=2175621 RepID=UPI000DAA2D7E|nr:hypothetical protein [Curtobacterium sp. MCBD17_026]WIB69768.1 hypothetical protein DEI85_11405 [Curtobacterium sp. MCBD17_026]